MPRFVSRVVELSFAEGPENSDEKMGCKRPKLTPLVDSMMDQVSRNIGLGPAAAVLDPLSSTQKLFKDCLIRSCYTYDTVNVQRK